MKEAEAAKRDGGLALANDGDCGRRLVLEQKGSKGGWKTLVQPALVDKNNSWPMLSLGGGTGGEVKARSKLVVRGQQGWLAIEAWKRVVNELRSRNG